MKFYSNILATLAATLLAQSSLLAQTSVEENVEENTEESTVYKTDEIVITGSRTEHKLTDAPIATELITRKNIENSGSKNAAEILGQHPGVQISRSFRGASIRIQGLESKHVLVLVDGQILAGRVDGVIDLSRFASEDIERIEIVRGPSSALYGSDAMGGVINIITRRAKSALEATATLSYGSLNAIDVAGNAGLKSKKWNTYFSAGWHQKDAFDLDPTDLATSGSAFSKFNIANRTQYAFTKNFQLDAKIDYQQRDNEGIDASSGGAVFDRRNLSEIMSVSLSPSFTFEDASKLKISSHFQFFRDQFSLDQRASNALDKYQEQKEVLSQTTVQYDQLFFDRHLVTIGAEGVIEHLDSERIVNGSGDRFRTAVFLQDEWNVFDDPLFVVIPGTRLDLDSSYGFHPTPKVAFRLDPHESVSLRGSYGMGFRSPAFKELFLSFENPSAGYVVNGNPELTPETSQSGNLSFELRAKSWAWISANLFHNEISDLIFTKKITSGGGTQQFTYENINAASTQGLEINSQFQISNALKAGIGTSFTIAKNRTQQRDLEGRSQIQTDVNLQYVHSEWGLNISAQASLIGKRPFYSDLDADGIDEQRFAEPYTNFNLRLGQDLGQHLTLFAGIDNILNAGDVAFLPIQPRSFYGGIRGQL